MYNLLIALPIEFLVGFLAGFCFAQYTDSSKDEIKYATLIFLVVNLFVFWFVPNMSPRMSIELAASWVVLSFGIIFGDIIKRQVLYKAAHKQIRRQEVLHSINALLMEGALVIRGTRTPAQLLEKLDDVQEQLQSIKYHLVKEKALLQDVMQLDDYCRKMADLAIRIGRHDKEARRSYFQLCTSLYLTAWGVLADLQESTQVILSQKTFTATVYAMARK